MKRAHVYNWKLALLHRCSEHQAAHLYRGGLKSKGDTALWIAVTMRVWAPWIRTFGLRDDDY